MLTRNLSRNFIKFRCISSSIENVLNGNKQFLQKKGGNEINGKISVKSLTTQCNLLSKEKENIPMVDEMISSIYEHVTACKPENYSEEDKKNKKLERRNISHSYKKFLIPLSTNEDKRKDYLSAMGNVRCGKVLEDLDHMAVHVAYAHNSDDGSLKGNMTLPRTIVTASVHRIDFHKEDINSSKDLIIDGQVTYAGSSSLQTSIRLFQHDENNNLALLLKANFIMVSRDPLDGNKKVRVHGLKASTPDEAETINLTKENIRSMGNNENREPSNEELRLIHNVYKGLINRNPINDMPVLEKTEMWMHKTSLSLTEICFPEYQNMYGKIFGGFLMRKALELAYTNAKLFCKGRVALRTMDRIEFARPVEIGNVLHLDSIVTYVENNFVQVKVEARVSDQNKLPELAEINSATLGQEARTHTNTFNFTMESVENKKILKILPKHYVNASTYIEGRRLLLQNMKRIFN